MGAHEQPVVRAAASAPGWVDAPPSRQVPVPAPVPPNEPLVPPGEFDADAEAVPPAYVPLRFPVDPPGFSTAAPRVRPLQWDQPRAQRMRGSQVTFGILGRSVVTGVIVLFVVWLAWANTFFLVPALPAVFWVLKDNWRRAPERRAPEPTLVSDVPRTAPRDPFAPLAADVVFDPRVRPEPDATTAG